MSNLNSSTLTGRRQFIGLSFAGTLGVCFSALGSASAFENPPSWQAALSKICSWLRIAADGTCHCGVRNLPENADAIRLALGNVRVKAAGNELSFTLDQQTHRVVLHSHA